MSFEPNSSRTSNATTNLIHFTHIRLADGSNNQVLGRLNMQLAHDGKRLQPGDVIMLTKYSPMLYSPSGEENPQRSPAIIIHQFTRVGYTSISDDLKRPIHCPDYTELEQSTRLPAQAPIVDTTAAPIVDTAADGNEYEENVRVECTPGNRCCSLYGVSMVICICEFDPVGDIDLDELRQYCWFADRDVDNMTTKQKRNMLYWWYMTNTYNICGAGNRKEPPACLKYAIRCAYPEADGKYVVFQPGRKAAAKRKKTR